MATLWWRRARWFRPSCCAEISKELVLEGVRVEPPRHFDHQPFDDRFVEELTAAVFVVTQHPAEMEIDPRPDDRLHLTACCAWLVNLRKRRSNDDLTSKVIIARWSARENNRKSFAARDRALIISATNSGSPPVRSRVSAVRA